MRRIAQIVFVFLLTISLISKANAINNRAGRMRVVAMTTLISTIVKEIGKEKVEVITVIPGGMCPGHFDIAPGTAKQIAGSDIFIHHGWEKWVENVIVGIKSASVQTVRAKTEGSWMVPDINMKAAVEIECYISETDKKNADYYKKNLKQYLGRLKNVSIKLKKRFQKYSGNSVICSEMQKEFVEWFGFKVAGCYLRAEDMNIKAFSELVSLAKREKAQLVIDNLQSGPNMGKEIAKDLKVKHVILTNFPQGDSYSDALESNARELEKGLK